jgi:hypothetical protein
MNKEKYLKYKEKYLRLKNLIGGSYPNMPNEINIQEYNYLQPAQKKFYTQMQLGKHIYYVKNPNLIRREQIENDPYAIINVEEYNNLPRDKYGFHWIANYDGGNFPISYRKGEKIIYDSELPHRNSRPSSTESTQNIYPKQVSRPSSQESINTQSMYSRPSSNNSSRSESQLNRLNKRLSSIMNDPYVKLSEEEYTNLPPGGYGFRWFLVKDTRINYYVKKRLFDIMFDPTVKITKEEYNSLPSHGYGYKWLLVRDYNRNIIYYVKR